MALHQKPHRAADYAEKERSDAMSEYVYDTFPHRFLIDHIRATGQDNFRVYFFPMEYTRLLQYIQTSKRIKKLLDEKLGGDDSV